MRERRGRNWTGSASAFGESKRRVFGRSEAREARLLRAASLAPCSITSTSGFHDLIQRAAPRAKRA